MDLSDIAVPAASAAGGAITTAWLAKVLIQNWLKKHDAMEVLLQTMLVQMTRIEERVSALQRAEERARDQGRDIAVIEKQLEEFRADLNGVGRKVREIESQ